jgi:hypothetical protein
VVQFGAALVELALASPQLGFEEVVPVVGLADPAAAGE